MKTILSLAAVLIFTSSFAQDNPVDSMTETKVKTTMVEKDDELVETKVKVITTKEQEVMTNPAQDHLRDADRYLPSTKVTKTILVDNDDDPFYETKTKIKYYTFKDVKYAFRADETGFLVTTMNGEKEMIFGKARRSTMNNYYIISLDDFSGIGYFDNDGNMVIEYYDSELDELVTERFEQMPF